MRPIMELKNVFKAYHPDKPAMRIDATKGIHLCIMPGDMCAIVGPSGSGKSTLLHTMGGLVRPDSGEVLYDGKNLAGLGDAALARHRNENIGFVLRDLSLIEKSSALDNVCVPLLFSKTPPRHVEEQALETMERLGIANLCKRSVSEMSGGQRQRVAIARALVMNPALILADEPTGALDSRSSESMLEVMREINRQGKAIVMVTHEPRVAQACARRYTMLDGSICIGEKG